MHLTKEDILNTDRIKRINLINSISGIKPANLIGTCSPEGVSNLAIFSSVVHLGSNPALLGFVLRPQFEVRRHTYENILATGLYTINHIHSDFVRQAHYTSAKFEAQESEFEKCKLTEEYLPGFSAPFVRESKLKMGMRFVEEVPIKANHTLMVVGEIEQLVVPDEVVNEEGQIDLASLENVGISGLNTYYQLSKIAAFPYARPQDLPDFSS